MARVNRTKYIILGMLYKKELSGYNMKNWIDSQFKYFWSESYGQIYPMLKKLEEEDLIEKKSVSDIGRQKNTYIITEKGREEFREYMMQSCEEEKMKSELLLKMAFGYLIPKEYNLKNLEEFRNRELKKKKEYEKIDKHLIEFEEGKEIYTYNSMTLNMGKKLNEAQLKWVEESIETIKNLRDK
ncbi:MAG: PadR family transcriptional regulator [Fusobacteriaceae bacterium]|nr:PadR family transcriptional regulator [Fusobacteriaceae bacterium]MBN2838358.1 PadR family transcriptional regulator [Fusobacteriaceae bacterium]